MLQAVTRRLGALPRRFPGYLPLLRRLHTRSVAVVMYHGVTRQPLPFYNWCQLDVTEFARQLEFLRQEYTVLPLREIIDRMRENQPLPPTAAALTFDDGFRNFRTTAFPVLERLQLPATVFLVTGLVGTGQSPWPERLYHALAGTAAAAVRLGGRTWPLGTAAQRLAAYRDLGRRLKQVSSDRKDELLASVFRQLGEPPLPADSPLALLDWDEVDRLRRSGLVHFGAHTHTHPILSRCPPRRQEEELRTSRDILRERGCDADLFAYPNGGPADCDRHTQRLLRELGYSCALTTTPGPWRGGQDRYQAPRICVGADTTLDQFELRLVGL